MCTSLIYRDAAGKPYFGRTLELTTTLPYQVTYFPAGFAVTSEIAGHPPLAYRGRHPILAVTTPTHLPTAQAPIEVADLKVLEGMNDQGLTFSLLSYPAAAGRQAAVPATQQVLSASDLGTWILGQFGTVAEVKAALATQPVALVPLPLLGGVESPFHYVAHDTAGKALVIEFHQGQMNVYDNPVGVMTNGPQFPWHLTNLDNYTFLSNVDKSTATFGSYTATQPDFGIATAGLPASSTSVGRFVRATYLRAVHREGRLARPRRAGARPHHEHVRPAARREHRLPAERRPGGEGTGGPGRPTLPDRIHQLDKPVRPRPQAVLPARLQRPQLHILRPHRPDRRAGPQGARVHAPAPRRSGRNAATEGCAPRLEAFRLTGTEGRTVPIPLPALPLATGGQNEGRVFFFRK
ncbi:MAG: linear amide C-N hydrolase [Roseateles sp.]|uniref:linear amide C-N hydrolase n=1 Tax=Roseateles sp. TaxID=1971397 RepID=UPI0039E7FC3C